MNINGVELVEVREVVSRDKGLYELVDSIASDINYGQDYDLIVKRDNGYDVYFESLNIIEEYEEKDCSLLINIIKPLREMGYDSLLVMKA